MPWYQRWCNVFRPERLNRDLDHELQFHLAETADRLMADGLSEQQARREARLRLGAYSTQKENTRDVNIAAWLDSTRADIIYGLRQLRAAPAFAAVAILSLALGIGANTAIFQLVDAVRLKLLPVRNPQALLLIGFEPDALRAGSWNGRSAVMTYPEWQELRSRQQAFTGMLAWSTDRFNLASGGEPQLAEGLYVDGDFFRTLGVTPILGRVFTAADDSSSCNPAAVISDSFWQRRFAGDPAVLTRKITLNGFSVPVIGVTPPWFFGLEVGHRYDVAVPFCADRALAPDKQGRRALLTSWWISAMGRLRPGWDARRANGYLRALSPAIMRATVPPTYRPDMQSGYLANKLNASSSGAGVSDLREQYEHPLWLLLATTGLVLLIACANIASLLLARASARQPEIAVRLALGAGRLRLIRQLLVESLILALSGAALGLLLAGASSRALLRFVSSPENPFFLDLAPDWRVLSFSAGLSILTCLLFGLLPALRASYLSPVTAMRSGGRSVTAGRERFGLRRFLVAAQIALSLVLLFGAVLFARTLNSLLHVDTGFQTEGILTVHLDFSTANYPPARWAAIDRELTARLTALPGVLSVAQASFTPVSGATWDNLVAVDGAPASRGRHTFLNEVGPGYFHTLSTPLLAGREFTDRDTAKSPKVAIVNEQFARKFFGGVNPVGHLVHKAADAGQPEPAYQIVGLVKDTKYRELREDRKPIVFFPIAQSEYPTSSEATFLLRVAGPGERFRNWVRAAVAAMSPAIGVDVRSFSLQLSSSLRRERLMAALSESFGLLAALLAAVGIYGVIAYSVAQRRTEIGVRVALGANRAEVIRLVVREAALLLAVGTAAGIILALTLSRQAAALLFGVPPHDLPSLFGAAALLGLVTLLAAYLPARRAAALDPLSALRSD